MWLLQWLIVLSSNTIHRSIPTTPELHTISRILRLFNGMTYTNHTAKSTVVTQASNDVFISNLDRFTHDSEAHRAVGYVSKRFKTHITKLRLRCSLRYFRSLAREVEQNDLRIAVGLSIMTLTIREDALEKHAKASRKQHSEDILSPFSQGYENYDHCQRTPHRGSAVQSSSGYRRC